MARSSNSEAEHERQMRYRILRCFWFDQTLDQEKLIAADGRRVRVFSPGWWNLEAGPDFRNAAIAFVGEAPAIKGAVEVLMRTSDWRHVEGDLAYGGVVLVVVLDHDIEAATVMTARGNEVPVLPLRQALSEQQLIDVDA